MSTFHPGHCILVLSVHAFRKGLCGIYIRIAFVTTVAALTSYRSLDRDRGGAFHNRHRQ